MAVLDVRVFVQNLLHLVGREVPPAVAPRARTAAAACAFAAGHVHALIQSQ